MSNGFIPPVGHDGPSNNIGFWGIVILIALTILTIALITSEPYHSSEPAPTFHEAPRE